MYSIIEVNKNCEFCGKRAYGILDINFGERYIDRELENGIDICKFQRYHLKCAKKKAKGEI